jgi:hypothetical protein
MLGRDQAQRDGQIGMRTRPDEFIPELPILRTQSIPLITRMPRMGRKARERMNIHLPTIRTIREQMPVQRGPTEDGL